MSSAVEVDLRIMQGIHSLGKTSYSAYRIESPKELMEEPVALVSSAAEVEIWIMQGIPSFRKASTKCYSVYNGLIN